MVFVQMRIDDRFILFLVLASFTGSTSEIIRPNTPVAFLLFTVLLTLRYVANLGVPSCEVFGKYVLLHRQIKINKNYETD